MVRAKRDHFPSVFHLSQYFENRARDTFIRATRDKTQKNDEAL